MSALTLPKHEPVITLEDWDALDRAEVQEGYLAGLGGMPEPGHNHSRSYHHGWRCGMFDTRQMEAPFEHMALVRAIMDRERVRRGEKPKGPWR